MVGASGSGKTTLLRLINRLADPSSGTVRIGGVDAASVDPVALRRRIGYVFQEVGLFPHMTVAENIAITPRLLGWDRARMAARVDELLGLVRLDADYRARLPHQLSGGERQRVGVARALAAGPEMVLMDEPFAALDPLTREALGQDYRTLHDKLGLTTLMITHDMVEALELADRIAVLRGGRRRRPRPAGGADRSRAPLRARADADPAQARRAGRGRCWRRGSARWTAASPTRWPGCRTTSAATCSSA